MFVVTSDRGTVYLECAVSQRFNFDLTLKRYGHWAGPKFRTGQGDEHEYRIVVKYSAKQARGIYWMSAVGQESALKRLKHYKGEEAGERE